MNMDLILLRLVADPMALLVMSGGNFLFPPGVFSPFEGWLGLGRTLLMSAEGGGSKRARKRALRRGEVERGAAAGLVDRHAAHDARARVSEVSGE